MNKLLLFSGGKDSLLAACGEASVGNKLFITTMDCGYISGLDWVAKPISKLQEVFGESNIINLGIQDCTKLRRAIVSLRSDKTVSDLAERYPYILPYQLQCLECHTSMLLKGILLCREFNIRHLLTGSRESQGFIVELSSMLNRYKELCNLSGIYFETPVYELINDAERPYLLSEYNICENFMEPQCWAGCPIRQELSINEIASLVRYYDEVIKPLCMKLVKIRI